MCVKPLVALFLLAGLSTQTFAQSSVEIATGVPAGLPGVSAPAQPAAAKTTAPATAPAAPVAQSAQTPAQAALAKEAANSAMQAVPMQASYKPVAQPTAENPSAAAQAKERLEKIASSPELKVPVSSITVEMLSKVQLKEMEQTYAKQLASVMPDSKAQTLGQMEKTPKVEVPKPYVTFIGGPMGAEVVHLVMGDGEEIAIPAGKTVRGIHVASITNGVAKVGKTVNTKGKSAKSAVRTVVAGEFLK